jgi:hypothetical protein
MIELHVQQPSKSFGGVPFLIDGNRVAFIMSRFRNVDGEIGAYIFRSDRSGEAAIIWRGRSQFYYDCYLAMGPDGMGYVSGVVEHGAEGDNLGQVSIVPIPTFLPWAQPLAYAVPPITVLGPQGAPGVAGKAGAAGKQGIPGPVGPMPSDSHIADIVWSKLRDFWNGNMAYQDGLQFVQNFVWDKALSVLLKSGITTTLKENGKDTWRMP